MLKLNSFKPEWLGGQNPMRNITGLQFLLIGIGTAYLFSASWHFSGTVFGDPFRIWRRQLLWILCGFGAGLAVYRMPHTTIRRLVPHLVWMSLLLNLLTYVPGLGYSSGGARRWIDVFGLTFQPSEFTRIALVLYMARMLEKNRGRLDDFRDALLPPLLVVIVMVLSVYFQNDFSTAAYLFFLAIMLFFAAGLPRYFTALFIFGSGVVSLLMVMAKPYRLERLQAWFRPEVDPSGAGYQILRAKLALARGSLWGQGIGLGSVKRGGLPSAHSDFVLAVVGEESGLFGIAIILFLFTLLAIKCWATAIASDNEFARWSIFGLSTAVYWQVLLNFAVVSGTLPATGIPLPLFSAGGSAVFMTVVIFGLMLNLGEKRR